jgi:hypothetical protein
LTDPNGDLNKSSGIWHLIEAIQRAVGGGVAKKLTIVAYFDAAGNCVGREEIQVTKIYPKEIFQNWLRSD